MPRFCGAAQVPPGEQILRDRIAALLLLVMEGHLGVANHAAGFVETVVDPSDCSRDSGGLARLLPRCDESCKTDESCR